MKPYGHVQQHQCKLLRLSCPATPSSYRMYTTSPPGHPPLDSPRSDGNRPVEVPEEGWSIDDFADAIVKEAKTGTAGGLEAENPTEPSKLDPSSPEPSKPAHHVSAFPSVNFLLMTLLKRTLSYGLLPEVTAEPTSLGPNDEEPSWKVTIALDELGISASGHGSGRVLAEVAASIQFDLMLNSPETRAKLQSLPRAEVSPQNATNTILAYCRMMSIPADDLRKEVTRTASGAYEACMFSGERQLGKPVVSAIKDIAQGMNPLILAHKIVNGDSDLWPAGLENPFQAKIVVGDVGIKQLQSLIEAAGRYCLTTTPSPGSYHRNNYNDANHGEDESASQNTGDRRPRDLDSLLAGLPFPPSTRRLLLLGASIRCMEPAIVLAALGTQDIYRQLAHGERYRPSDWMDPYIKNTLHGDHSEFVLLFQRLRKHGQKDSEFKDEEEAARAFANFDPSRIRSINAAAKDIERVLISAGLARYPEGDSNIQLPGSELEVRAQPYGGRLNLNYTKMQQVRHLLAYGFGHNIAQYGYGTLVPGAHPELRVGSQKVHIGSPLRTSLNTKQLNQILQHGPLVVLSGTSKHPEGRGLAAQYSSPISTWQAALFGEDLSLTGETAVPPMPGAAQLVLNGWLPILVKSQAQGASDGHVRDMILEARKALHRAMRKAMLDYIKYSSTSTEFYKLLKQLPIEASMGVKKKKTVKGENKDTVEG